MREWHVHNFWIGQPFSQMLNTTTRRFRITVHFTGYRESPNLVLPDRSGTDFPASSLHQIQSGGNFLAQRALASATLPPQKANTAHFFSSHARKCLPSRSTVEQVVHAASQQGSLGSLLGRRELAAPLCRHLIPEEDGRGGDAW